MKEGCPSVDCDKKIKELEDLIAEKDNLIKEKDSIIDDLNNNVKDIDKREEDYNNRIKELEGKLSNQKDNYEREKDNWNREKNRLERNNSGYRWNNVAPSYDNSENERLKVENKRLEDKINNMSKNNMETRLLKEKYVTIFDLNSILYKTYLGDELLTQAEMTDFNGYIKPFISNNRTMLPIRYVSRSLGIDVKWDNKTRVATFTNDGKNNILKSGIITISADTLEMKDQHGNIINVDSKPILKGGRFYISITNLTKAFGGTNGTVEDGIKNTIEWDQKGQKALVYKYVK